jgi:hypothetical protein
MTMTPKIARNKKAPRFSFFENQNTDPAPAGFLFPGVPEFARVKRVGSAITNVTPQDGQEPSAPPTKREWRHFAAAH